VQALGLIEETAPEMKGFQFAGRSVPNCDYYEEQRLKHRDHQRPSRIARSVREPDGIATRAIAIVDEVAN
jgi:hypothetical protein